MCGAVGVLGREQRTSRFMQILPVFPEMQICPPGRRTFQFPRVHPEVLATSLGDRYLCLCHRVSSPARPAQVSAEGPETMNMKGHPTAHTLTKGPETPTVGELGFRKHVEWTGGATSGMKL